MCRITSKDLPSRLYIMLSYISAYIVCKNKLFHWRETQSSVFTMTDDCVCLRLWWERSELIQDFSLTTAKPQLSKLKIWTQRNTLLHLKVSVCAEKKSVKIFLAVYFMIHAALTLDVSLLSLCMNSQPAGEKEASKWLNICRSFGVSFVVLTWWERPLDAAEGFSKQL